MAQDDVSNTNTAPGATLYPVSEIVAATEKLFGGKYKNALVLAALRNAKVENVSLDDAIKIVHNFANTRVV